MGAIRAVDADAPSPEGADCRCTCGRLLARMTSDGVELKCRRCKRTVRVPLLVGPDDDPSRFRPVEPVPIGDAG